MSLSGASFAGGEVDDTGRALNRLRVSAWDRTKLRRWVHSGRLWYGVVGGLNANCCFMHIPKCGGTSITHALRRMCPIQRRLAVVGVEPSRRAASLLVQGRPDNFGFHDEGPRTGDVFASRRALLLYFLASDAALVASHFLSDKEAYENFRHRYHFVSVLRNPLERMISHYNEERRANYLAMPFDAYLETNVAWRHATTAVRYFSGTAHVDLCDTDNKLATAKENLKQFSVVGFTEGLGAFSKRFTDVFGRRVRVVHQRRSRLPRPAVDQNSRRR